jgi:hypothetical protein
MSLGGGPLEDAYGEDRLARFTAKADADRAAHAAGHKSLFARLRERLRPHRQEPRGGQEIPRRAFDDPGK